MSGTPSEAEVRTQWQAIVNILEKARNYYDGTVMGAGGLFDTLEQAYEGEYIPVALPGTLRTLRSMMSSMVDGSRALEMLSPVMWEYARISGVNGVGGYANVQDCWKALWEYFAANTYTVKTRGITYAATATSTSNTSNSSGGYAIIGNGTCSRLTVDQGGYNLEACTVESKRIRCIQDSRSGALENAEVFEVLGRPQSADALLRGSFGSGDIARATIRNRHAGSGAGGSILRNSSFSTYSSTASPKFSGWTETSGGSALSQDTTNYYREHPPGGTSTRASMKITWGGSTVTVSQTVTDMANGRLDPDTPYFLRVMVNKAIGSGSGGNFIVRLGAVTVTTAVSSISASNWTEVIVPLTSSSWFRVFNQNSFTVQIEWASGSSGYLLVDDVILCPFDLVDGTYWVVRHNAASPTSWKLDDVLTFTDTGGAAGTGKIQWWLWVAGFGSLPSTSGSPTIDDPS